MRARAYVCAACVPCEWRVCVRACVFCYQYAHHDDEDGRNRYHDQNIYSRGENTAPYARKPLGVPQPLAKSGPGQNAKRGRRTCTLRPSRAGAGVVPPEAAPAQDYATPPLVRGQAIGNPMSCAAGAANCSRPASRARPAKGGGIERFGMLPSLLAVGMVPNTN